MTEFHTSHPVYVFSLRDETAWKDYLDQHGYCVLRSVLEPSTVTTITDLIWNDMSRLYNVDRADSATWGSIPTGAAGIVSKGLPQSPGPWLVRGHDNVRQAFRCLWETDELLVSMDSLLCWLPWWRNAAWKPRTEGLHLDQNPFCKPDRICVQGMIPLLDVTKTTGGLEVVPDSHLPDASKRFKQNHPHFNSQYGADWCPCEKLHAESPAPLLLLAQAGDMILWDSRTIHGGRVGEGIGTTCVEGETADDVTLARLAVTVCMTPRALASPGALTARQRGFEKGMTFTHWPHEAHITDLSPKGYEPVTLPPHVQELI